MSKKLGYTAALAALVVCSGAIVHAESLENSSLEAGRQFDLTAQQDKSAINANLDVGGLIEGREPQLNTPAPKKKKVHVPPTDEQQGGPKRSGIDLGRVAFYVGSSALVVGGFMVGFGVVPGAIAGIFSVVAAYLFGAGVDDLVRSRRRLGQ